VHSLNYPSNKKVYVDNDCQAAWHSVRKSCLIFVKFISRILSFHHENTTVLLQNREWSSFSICLLICHTRKPPGQVTGCCTFLVFFCFLSLVLYSCLLFILQAQPPYSQPFSGTVWPSCSSRGCTDTSALELLCSFSCLQVHWVCNGDFPVHCLSYGWKVHVGNLCISFV